MKLFQGSLNTLIILGFTLLLSACSFHFRGDYDVPESLQKLSLTSHDPYSTFTRMLKDQLRQNDIWLQKPADDIPNLYVISESISSSTMSIYQNTRAAEKLLTLTVQYRVTIPNQTSQTFTASVSRSFLDNPLTALAKSLEENMIEDEMRKAAALQVIRQLARLKSYKDERYEQETGSDELTHVQPPKSQTPTFTQ